MKAKHVIGAAMMALPLALWLIGMGGLAMAFAIAVPIGWQLFFSNGERDKRKHRSF